MKSEPKKQIEVHLDKIVQDIHNNRRWLLKDSFIAKLVTRHIVQKLNPFKTGVGIANKVQVEDTCNKCGICKLVCPTDNIEVDNKPIFSQKCVSCLSCTHNCPKNAIRLTSEKSKERFRNSHISLQEIIESNK